MSDRLLHLPLAGVPGHLVRQLATLIAGADEPAPMFPMLVLEAVTTRPWSSATFEGQRHRLDLRLHGDAACIGAALDRLIELLPEAEFELPRQIVAEARLTSLRVDPDPAVAALALTIEVLTVSD